MSDFPVSKSVQFMSKVGIKERPYTINAEIVNRDSVRLETGYGQLFLNRAGVACLLELLKESLSVMDSAGDGKPAAHDDAPDDAQKPDAKQKRKRS